MRMNLVYEDQTQQILICPVLGDWKRVKEQISTEFNIIWEIHLEYRNKAVGPKEWRAFRWNEQDTLQIVEIFHI